MSKKDILKENKQSLDIALLGKDIETIKKEIEMIQKKLDERYVSHEEFKLVIENIHAKYDPSIRILGIIGTSALVGLVAIAVKVLFG